MLKFIGVLAAALMLALTPTVRANAQSSGAKACFQNCRAELKQAGTFNSYPQGYCRRKCDYWVGAPAGVR
jgi:hypothetical protein